MPYIAFPHQVSNIARLESILAFVAHLIGAGEDIEDDGILGYGLVRAGLYKFRGQVHELETRIAQEESKTESNQGPRTAARDIRRTFLLFGLIRRTGQGWVVTDRGQRILAAGNSEESVAAKRVEWTTALLNLKFRAATDEARVNEHARIRPLRIMLEMLAITSQPTYNLALAFAARTESNRELSELGNTVNALATGVLEQAAAITSVGASQSLARDNVKILPSMADQLGLISRTPSARLTGLGKLALERMRSAKPIWVADLRGDSTRQAAACALLVCLQHENLNVDVAASMISSTGASVDAILQSLLDVGVVVEDRQGVIHLRTDVSFDPYQDASDEVFEHPAYQAALVRMSAILEPYDGTDRGPRALVPRRRHAAYSRAIEDPDVVGPEPDDEEITPLSYAELVSKRQEAAVARERRNQGHELIVRLVSDFYRERYAVQPRYTQLYDLFLLPKSDVLVAHEMKTITPQDERSQIMAAVGQLKYYEYFEGRELAGEEAKIINIVAVDRSLSDASHKDFLFSLGIGLVWADGEVLHFEGAARDILNELPLS